MFGKLISGLKRIFSTQKLLKEEVENIKITNRIETKNYTPSSNRKPQQIVIHYTAGEINGRGQVISWINNPISEVSYHYIIAYDGEIIQLVEDINIAWHAGTRNAISLGIALESPYDQGTPEYTDAQIKSCILLLAHLCQKWNIPAQYPTWGLGFHSNRTEWNRFRGFLGHESVARSKADPGKNFPYKEVLDKVQYLLSL